MISTLAQQPHGEHRGATPDQGDDRLGSGAVMNRTISSSPGLQPSLVFTRQMAGQPIARAS
jgi:hypothetical protein